ncbi:MAG: ABC transporter ATP-binding protein [Anaerolineales bacterium]
MSIFGGLDAEAYDRQYSDADLLRRIVNYLRPLRSKLLGATLFMAAMAVVSAGLPILISRGVDQLVAQRSSRIIFTLVLLLLLIGILNWVFNYFRSRLFAEIIGDAVIAMRTNAFEAAVDHDLSFYDQFQSGRIVTRITSDTQEFGQALRLVGDVLNQLSGAVVLSVVLFAIEWRMALLVIGSLPIIFGLGSGWRRIARRATRQGARAMANVNVAIQEAVTGINVAKNFRQEAAIYQEFDAVNRQSYVINIRRGFVLATVFPVLNGFMGIGTALLMYFGSRAVGMSIISAGAWYLFLVSLDRFWFPIMQLAGFWSQFQSGLSAAERVFALEDAKPVVMQHASNRVPTLKGAIHLERVGFRYSDQEVVLRDFTLRIDPGESVALVGHTGAGKSSITKLIARYYEFQSGSITVDGYDLRSLDLQQYRRQVGIVSQVPFLFSGTVGANIRYTCPQASDDEIMAVARQIGNGEWMETLPAGLNSDVGERGNRLSMGQRQLVALARVLVQRPAIFILDEATASVDPFTEWQIQEALNLVMRGRTSILIAHRLSTVRAVDRIVVLRTGRIIEQGNHNQLMAAGGHYADLYNTYFRHQSLEYVERRPDLMFAALSEPGGGGVA